MHIISEIKVSYKPNRIKNTIKITSSEDAYKVILNDWDKNTLEFQEEFKILLLNNSNEPLGIYSASKGGITFSLVDLRIMFGVILKSGSTSFITAHNHPSSKAEPSIADINIYKRIKKIARFHDLNYLDNLIITSLGKYSFKDEGY